MKSLYSPLFIFMSLAAVKSEAAKRNDTFRDMSVLQYLQELSSVPNVTKREDPFEEPPPPFVVPREPTVSKKDTPQEAVIVPSNPPLERFPLREYGVVAVLLGDKYPRALVKINSSGSNNRPWPLMIVKEGDRIGSRNGVIQKIYANGLSVEETVKFKKTSQKVKAFLEVGNKGVRGEASQEQQEKVQMNQQELLQD